MKKIYLDSINIEPTFIGSILNVIYNIIIINRSSKVTNYKLSFEKMLERQYLELIDAKLHPMIK